jgi:uncharacterized delta-60 repeat protein
MRRFLLLWFFIGTHLFLNAQHGTIDPSFNPMDVGFGKGDGPNGVVKPVVTLPNGKVLIGGDFDSYNGKPANYIACLNPDGSLDPNFKMGEGANGLIYDMAIQPDGKILIGGSFTTYNGAKAIGIARIHVDGTIDVDFIPDINYYKVRKILPLRNGKILLIEDIRVICLNNEGKLDVTFNSSSGANMGINTLIELADGKILIGGRFTRFNSVPTRYIARLNENGTLDATFTDGANGVVASIAQTNGSLLIGGDFTLYNGRTVNKIIRLKNDGTLDEGFTPSISADEFITSIAIQANNKILLGKGTNSSGIRRGLLSCLKPDGTSDNTFKGDINADGYINSIVASGNNRIFVSGEFSTYPGAGTKYLACLYSDGTPDHSFNPGTGASNSIYTLAIQPDSKILIGGTFITYNNISANRLARLKGDGTLDESFDTKVGANGSIHAIAVQPNGKILIGGRFTTYNGKTVNRIARLNIDGTLDDEFKSGMGAQYEPNSDIGNVYNIIVQPDGKILIAGEFTKYDGMPSNYIARLNSDGTIDSEFTSLSEMSVGVMAVQADGKIIIGGYFRSYGGITVNNIARLNPDGTLDDKFEINSDFQGSFNSLKIQADGKIVAGGYFSINSSTSDYQIIRFNKDGAIDATFNPITNANDYISTISIQPDGKILIGGWFNDNNSNSIGRLSRLNNDGTLDASFTAGSGDLDITSILEQPDGNLIIAGEFTSYNGIGRNRIARINSGSLLTGTIAATTNCGGSTISVPFTAKGAFAADNVFTAQLSDANGSFANPTTIGTLTATASGTIAATIPAGTAAGTGYRIRVISSAPALTAPDNGSDLTINAAPQAPGITAGGETTFCTGGSVTLTSSVAQGNQWYKDGAEIAGATSQSYTAIESGSYTVRITQNGCSSPSAVALAVTVNPLPSVPTIAVSGNTLTSSAASGNQWFLNGAAIQGATNASYEVQEAGPYTVQVTSAEGCTATSLVHNFVATSIGGPGNWRGEVVTFPNPVQKTLTIKNPKSRKLSITVYTVQGTKVYQGKVITTQGSIDMQGLPAGLYQVVITDVSTNETIRQGIIKH